MDFKLRALLDELLSIHESDGVDESQRDSCSGLAADVGILYSNAMAILDKKICDYLSFYRGTAKLQYVLLRIFRVLAAKGFCSDKASQDDGADGACRDRLRS